MGPNRELGRDNKLLWHISEDLKRFKTLTTGHVIIMGRKTYESIGKPLPNRYNIIITRDKDYLKKNEGVSINQLIDTLVVDSLYEALQQAKSEYIQHKFPGEAFIIGGGQIYAEGIKLVDTLYLTLVEGVYKADTFFPDYSMFKKVISKEEKEEKGQRFAFIELTK